MIDYRFAPNKTIEQDLVDQHLDIGLISELTNKSNLLSDKIAEGPLVLVTSSKVKSIDWQTLITLGFISHPDAAHHRAALPQ